MGRPYIKRGRKMKCLKHVSSKELYRKARASIFVLTIFLMAIACLYPQRTHGGEIYTDTDKNGIRVISNIPSSRKDERKAQKTERRTLGNENKAKQKQDSNERQEMGKLLLLYSIVKQ
jgi:hypothetical protein